MTQKQLASFHNQEYRNGSFASQLREAGLRAAMTQIPIIMVAINLDGVITLADGEGFAQLDIDPDTLVGQSVFDIVQCQHDIVEHIRCGLEGKSFAASVVYRNRLYECQYDPVYNADGYMMGIAVVAIDVTDDTQTFEALRSAEIRYQTLVEQIPAITYIAAIDEAGSTLYTSPQVETLLGFSQAEWMADHTLWLKQIHPDDCAFVVAELLHSRVTGVPRPCEYRMLHRDGHVVWFLDQSRLVRDAQGQPAFLHGVMLDITERKHLAKILAETRHQQAARLEAERFHFVHYLHDGPVQQLLGLSYQLAQMHRICSMPEASSQQLQTLNMFLEDSRQRVLDIVSQLRTTIGDVRPVDLRTMGLTTTLQEYIDRLKREYGEHMPRIIVETNLRDQALSETVALHLFRIAQEGLHNVIKHAQASQALVRLQMNVDTIELSIQDDGRGFVVPPSLHMFLTTDHIGLIGIQDRVTAACGQWTVVSAPDEGTEVWVCLPCT